MRLIDADELLNNIERSYLTKGEKRLFSIKVRHAPTVEERPQNCFTRQDLQDWLYQIMFNNIGTNFELACEELISRLDGFERFVEDRRKEGR